MFNANVDSGFGQSVSVIDLKNILLKAPLGKTPIGEGLYLDTEEAVGRYGSMTKGFSHTRENGAKGDINKKFFTVQFMCSISDGVETKRVRVNIFKNGKIGFSGGFLSIGSNIANQAELIRRFIVNSYTEREKFLYNPFTYNNLSGQFKVNGVSYDDSVFGRNLHKIRTNEVSKRNYRVNIPEYILKKCREYNFWQTSFK